MGNIFYFLLTEKEPFESFEEQSSVSDGIKQLIKNGVKPTLSGTIMNATKDPCVNAIVEAISMCHIQKYSERATASRVRDFLISRLEHVHANEWKNE